MHYLVINEQLQSGYDKDSVTFLVETPRGAYTTVRTYEKSSIFQYALHCKRLAYSCSVMINDQGVKEIPKGLLPITNTETLTPIITKNLKYGLGLSNETGEQKVTIHITWDLNDESYKIWIHYSTLPELAFPPVSVEVMPGSRTHIKAKDSEWARYRRRIDEMKINKKSTDCVLLDVDGKLNECTAANFFAIKDGKVHTGITGVLYGTVEDTVFKACSDLGIEVVHESPLISDITHFSEVFLSSTTRLVVPIDKLIVHSADCFFNGVNDVHLDTIKDSITEYEYKPNISKKINDVVISKLKELSILIE